MAIGDLPPELGAAGSGAAMGSMFGPLGTIAGAGIGLAGGLLTNQQAMDRQQQAQGFSASQQLQQEQFNQQAADTSWARQTAMTAQQNQFNSQQAQLQRDWEQQMSSTAYQRATADMKAAGINPMVAYMQGGASTPGGSAASAASASAPQASGAALGGPGPIAPQNVLASMFQSAKDAAEGIPTVQNLYKMGSKIDMDAELSDALGYKAGSESSLNARLETNAEKDGQYKDMENQIQAIRLAQARKLGTGGPVEQGASKLFDLIQYIFGGPGPKGGKFAGGQHNSAADFATGAPTGGASSPNAISPMNNPWGF